MLNERSIDVLKKYVTPGQIENLVRELEAELKLAVLIKEGSLLFKGSDAHCMSHLVAGLADEAGYESEVQMAPGKRFRVVLL